ncbi:MAG: hypothetical protein ACXWRG_11480 [Bdellovibrio sp.]
MLQTLCLAKKNKYKFCSTTISCNSRLSIVAYVKQSNMIANNFSSQSTAKGKKGLTKKKAAGNVRFHAKKKAIKGATKSKKVLSVVANKFTAKSK